jgi:hypothetical protein
MTISEQVREYKAANPDATNAKVATACKTTALYVYQILRPKSLKKAKPTKGQKILREVISHSDGLSAAVARAEKACLHAKIDELEIVIKAMRTQTLGLENVITYLEAKLGIDEIDARLESTRD